jgi:hypothetical protein
MRFVVEVVQSLSGVFVNTFVLAELPEHRLKPSCLNERTVSLTTSVVSRAALTLAPGDASIATSASLMGLLIVLGFTMGSHTLRY